jgi:hypothetical protein
MSDTGDTGDTGDRGPDAAEQPDAREEAEQTASAPDEASEDAAEEQPLARVRYGLGKELQLFPDSLVILRREEFAADRFELAQVRRVILTPGDPNPSKLILMLELDDGATIIAAEGMSSVSEFRTLLGKLREVAPQIETDPPDMDVQLGQALDIRRRSLLGCYGSVAAACILAYILYLVLAYFGAHPGH